MANYQVTRSKHATLTASTVDTVTVTPQGYTAGNPQTGNQYAALTVLNRDAALLIYFTIDGTTPTVAGDNTYVLPPGNFAQMTLPIRGQGVVNLISSGGAAYSVTGFLGTGRDF